MILYLILTFSWFIFMTYLSHQDGDQTGKTSRELARKLQFLDSDIDNLNRNLRRAAHIIVFAVFTLLLGLTLHSALLQIWYGIIAVIIWAYLDELTKPLVEGRHFDWVDVALNLLGVGIGTVVLQILLFWGQALL